MPLEELEEVWGIKILDEKRAKPHNYYPLSETDFGNKPYKSEKDAFYIELFKTYPMSYTAGRNMSIGMGTSTGLVSGPNYMVTTIFIIRPTKKYHEKHGEMLPSAKLRELFIGQDEQYVNYCSLELTKNAPIFYEIDGRGKFCSYYHLNGPNYHPLPGSDKVFRTGISIYPHKILISRKQTLKEIKAQEELKPLKKPAITAKTQEWEEVPCRGLKPITSLEDILYQFYINMR